jgi:hypothetical protein
MLYFHNAKSAGTLTSEAPKDKNFLRKDWWHMSKIHPKLSNACSLLEEILQARGWKLQTVTSTAIDGRFGGGTCLHNYATKEIAGIKLEMFLEIEFYPAPEAVSTPNIRLFCFSSKEFVLKVLDSSIFCQYQGWRSIKEFKVDAPKDIVSLLDLYDKTAINLGKIQLFQIQEKTK